MHSGLEVVLDEPDIIFVHESDCVPAAKRGPRPPIGDAALVGAIRAVLAATPFHGEGYRKVRTRLAHCGLAVSGKRVLRLMRAHQFFAPRRLGPPNGDPAHAGRITTIQKYASIASGSPQIRHGERRLKVPLVGHCHLFAVAGRF